MKDQRKIEAKPAESPQPGDLVAVKYTGPNEVRLASPVAQDFVPGETELVERWVREKLLAHPDFKEA